MIYQMNHQMNLARQNRVCHILSGSRASDELDNKQLFRDPLHRRMNNVLLHSQGRDSVRASSEVEILPCCTQNDNSWDFATPMQFKLIER